MLRLAPRHRRLYANYATATPVTIGASLSVFDRSAKTKQKDRSAARDAGVASRTVDYVRDEVAERLLERLEDIKRTFRTVVDVGSGPGRFARLLSAEKVGKVVMIDSSEKLLNRDPESDFEVQVERIHADEESLHTVLPPNSQEAIVSCLSLHWINDLPGILVQIQNALQPDGLFLAALLGGDTLFELRTSLQLAEAEREGGISPHVSPMASTQFLLHRRVNPTHPHQDTSDMSALLGRAGFTFLTVDTDEIKVAYPSMFELIEDLRDMGEGNAVLARRTLIHRDTLIAASSIYKALHGNEDGSIPATFQIIYLIGWKPSPNQAKALERGSGETKLSDVL